MTPATQLEALLGLRTPPVAVVFQASPPPDVPRIDAAAPSSCGYWKRAADGQTFYTEAADHLHCPIGAYTHGVAMPSDTQRELEGVVATMVGLGYLRMSEVPSIPKRDQPFGVAVYAPLKKSTTVPDVILVCGNARQIMLLEEAASAAGVGASTAMMGRPTFAALPAAMQAGRGVASLGCIGNRVYTQMGDDELYYALPGKHLAAVAGKLAEIVHANRELEKYHQARANTKELSHAK
jgi:uncharacterized protein (DUF169 family)